MDNESLQRLKDVLAENQQVAIAVGQNSTLDEMAAALGLYLSLSDSLENISIASPTEPIVELSSLVGIDKVKTSLGREGGDLIVSFPYKEGEIEKVSYTLDNGHLNIVVKAGNVGLSFNEKEINFKKGGSLPTLLFIIGTARLSDLGELFNPEELKDTTIVNIDNKSENQGFGDLVLVSPRFSSVSEMIANLIVSLRFKLDLDIAQNLLSGISFATNNFQDSKTSFLAFEMAGALMKMGAQRTKKVSKETSFDDFSSLMSLGAKPKDKFKAKDLSSFLGKQDASLRKSPQEEDAKGAPADWLAPKVYKGSTKI